MDEVFLFESYYIVLFHIPFLFLLALVNTLIFLKTKKSTLLKNFLLLQCILALWMISKLLKTFAPDAPLKFFFVACQYAGVCFLGAFFVRFAHIFAKGSPPPKRVMYVLYGLSSAMFLVVITNPLHHLFYSHFDFWGDSFGPLFFLQQAIQFALLLAGVLLCVKAYFASFGQKRIQAVLFAIAILIPIAANVLYVFKWFKALFGFSPPFDITPVSASISLALFAFATFRLELFDSLIVALETALSNVPQGILLISGGKAAYINKTLKKMLENSSLHTTDDGFLVGIGKKETVQLSFSIKESQDFTVQNKTDGYIRVTSQPIKNGVLVCFMDITEKQAAVEQLMQKNKELSAVHEKLSHQAETQRSLVAARTRNAIAAEAHDILGHSVILALSLLEMAQTADEPSRSEYILKAAAFLKNSLPELMEASVENNRRSRNVLSRLNELAGGLSNAAVSIDVSTVGKIRVSNESADALYKICRESITNALRHSRCAKIYVILKGDENETQLFVIDDGEGCENIQKGMGIKGMEQRARILGGSFSCRTLGGRGFCVEAALPSLK
jgi:signal transduction histidine kinase